MIKGSKRKLTIERFCIYCDKIFACADPKAERCPVCRGCQYCGKYTRAVTRICMGCRAKHPTDKQKDQWKRLHISISGDNNVSKRPEVRKKISESKMGELNPARIYLEKFQAHIAKYRPGKVSKLEGIVAPVLSSFKPQYELAWYKIDFANVEQKIAVEIQGCWHHSCQKCFPDSPKHKTQFAVVSNDKRKKKFLETNGWSIVEIWEHEIRPKSQEELRTFCEERINYGKTNFRLS